LLAPAERERILFTNVGKYAPDPPSMSRSILQEIVRNENSKQKCGAHPSKTASPKGRVELDPPRKRFHTVVAKVCACASEVKLAAPVAPPRLIVMILPLAWQALISAAMNWQLARLVPEKTAPLLLQVCWWWDMINNGDTKYTRIITYIGKIYLW